MTHDEEQVTAGVAELKKIAGKTPNQCNLAALATIIDAFETMLPYVRVGLRVSPSDETVEAINLLLDDGILTQEQWIAMTERLRLPGARNNPQPRQQPVWKPFRAVKPPRLGRSRWRMSA